MGTVLRFHWRAVLAASAGVVACFSIFYLSTAFALSHLTVERGQVREQVLALQLAANTFLALGIVLSARVTTTVSLTPDDGAYVVPDGHPFVVAAAATPLRRHWTSTSSLLAVFTSGMMVSDMTL